MNNKNPTETIVHARLRTNNANERQALEILRQHSTRGLTAQQAIVAGLLALDGRTVSTDRALIAQLTQLVGQLQAMLASGVTVNAPKTSAKQQKVQPSLLRFFDANLGEEETDDD